jgi:hypothetical protein
MIRRLCDRNVSYAHRVPVSAGFATMHRVQRIVGISDVFAGVEPSNEGL